MCETRRVCVSFMRDSLGGKIQNWVHTNMRFACLALEKHIGRLRGSWALGARGIDMVAGVAVWKEKVPN